MNQPKAKSTMSSEDKIKLFSDSLNSKKAVDFVELLGRQAETEAERKLEFLYNSAHASLRDASRRRISNRTPAFIFRILTTLLSAVVTILLGMKINNQYAEVVNNAALIISALMTLVTAFSSFTDNYSLWVLYTGVSERMRVIIKEIEYYTAGNSEIHMETVIALKGRYEKVLNEIANRVTELRAEDTTKGR